MATYLPFSDVVAAYGYRQPPPSKQRANLYMLALAYVVVGGALGTVAGTGVAMASFHSGFPKLVFQETAPVQASSTVASSTVASSTVASSTVDSVVTPPPQLPALTSHPVDLPASIAKPSPLKLTKSSFVLTHKGQAIHRRVLPKQIALTGVSTQIATAATGTATAPALPAVVSTGTTNYKFYSEGDFTVADFDASTGTIESYEGRTFVLGTTALATATTSLQDSGSSVHYRCDDNGSCTLFRAGLVMQNVRLM